MSRAHKKRSILWLVGTVAIAALLVACWWQWRQWWPLASAPPATALAAPAPGHTIVHAQGRTQVPLSPQRVAVFDLAALDTLDALGVEVMGVAGKDFPGHLARYREARYLTLGTLFEPDYEAVNAARPDLIITGGRSSARFAQLSRMAPTIDLTEDNARPVDAVASNTLMLGKVFDKDAEALTRIAALRTAIAELRSRTAGKGSGLIVLVTGGKISAYGPGSRFGIIHTEFGVPPAAEGLSQSLHGEAVNAEFIQKTNPDWLFVIDRDAAIGQAGAARQVLDNPLVRTTTAWKTSQVLYLDAVNWYLVGDGLQALQRWIAEISAAYGHGQ